MGENPRARKIADRIREIVATTIDRGIKDPRLGFVTVTDVRVTGDLQHASIFYTVYGDDEAKAGSTAALESAKGVLRREVGKGLGLRLTPTLEFIADAVPENANVIEDLLREARERDAAIQNSGVGASYAGEADPYRKPRDEFDEVDGEDAPAEDHAENDSASPIADDEESAKA
ncbi:30S ribosome-binding factor RbfA [Humidisolicoccus flavus]|uniref:30S ribosome-binding factor RbfA n=1 Tax=Humidisolicoccus flavus TaxID=3111414 RepID=UPI0032566AD9